MNKLLCMVTTSMLSMTLALPVFANSCMPIAQACMKQGYYKGGHDSGKGLVEDCVMPVVKKTKTLPDEQFSDDVLQQCEATIQEKMQSGEADQ